PGAHGRAQGGEPRHRHLPHLPRAADAALPAAVARDLPAWLAGLVVVARAGVSDVHHSFLHLADDGLLQVGAEGDRGGGDRRRLQPARRVREGDPARVGARNPDRRHLHFHADDAEFIYALTFISTESQVPVTL